MAKHPDNTWLVVDRSGSVIGIGKTKEEAEAMVIEAEQRFNVIADTLPPIGHDARPIPRP